MNQTNLTKAEGKGRGMANITIGRVLEAIEQGNHSGKAICDYTKINKSNMSRYLHFLEDNDLVYLSVNKKAFITDKGKKFLYRGSCTEKIIKK